MVITLRANGDSIGVIARKMGIAEKTCRKHYAVELQAGNQEVEATLSKILMRNATQKSHVGGSNRAVELLQTYFLQNHPEQRVRVVTDQQENDVSAWLAGADDTTAAEKAALDALNGEKQTRH